MYDLLAIDIDGTLINFEQPDISERVKNAIFKAQEKGVYVVLISGRNYYSMKRFVEELKIKEYGITTNGAVVIDLKTRTKIIETCLSKEMASDICTIIEKADVPYAISADLNVYATEKHAEFSSFKTLAQEEDNLIIIENGQKYTAENHINKFVFVADNEKLSLMYEEIIEKYGDRVNVEHGYEFHMEVYPKTINKGVALTALAKQINIPIERVMAIGDAENDIEMLKMAGLGVAMGNAINNVKDYADYITKPIDEDGVAWAIEKFILNK
ncbi:MAG: HAD family phosphatase [Eubacteriaceae bacterium]|nr:HAD family phosphatase [Eubacteriaceae bacterium]